MGQTTGISWTDATWNPIRGCSRVSSGCMECYAEKVAARFSGPGQPYEGLAKKVGGRARWTGALAEKVGGESGPHHRPMQLGWLGQIVEQCRAAGVPVWVKQDSGPKPGKQGRIPDDLWVQQLPAPAGEEG